MSTEAQSKEAPITEKKIVIAHLYPREMSIYGDIGNVMTLAKRLEWRGYTVVVKPVEIGQSFDFTVADIVFGGGGQDRGQLLVGEDLMSRGEALRIAAASGMPMLLVCGLYQLFGHEFKTIQGKVIHGIDVFNATTLGSSKRMIGNIILDTAFGPLVGFENHSGQTRLAEGQSWLGKVRRGYGNDVSGKYEGAISHNAFGTYLHGPILPKNPSLADHLILEALKRRGLTQQLEPLDDRLELAAAQTAMKLRN